MKTWRLVASRTGVYIDYETEIQSVEEPDFWEQYNIAMEHGCEYFYCEEVEAA